MPYFDVKSPKRSARLKLDAPFFVIGRGERIPLFHDDPSISREHAAIVVKKSGVRLRDLGSRNGVILNGEAIAKYAEVDLKPGDFLKIGATLLVLREGEPPLRKAEAAPADEPGTETVRAEAPAPAESSPESSDDLLATQDGVEDAPPPSGPMALEPEAGPEPAALDAQAGPEPAPVEAQARPEPVSGPPGPETGSPAREPTAEPERPPPALE